LFFSESVLNAPAGNGAIAFRVQGPVHTLIGEESVGTQAIDLAASLLHAGIVDRCLVVGTEEWNEVVAHAYGQVDGASRRQDDSDGPPPLSEGAVALLLELEIAAARRGARPRAVLAGGGLGRGHAEKMETAIAASGREAFRRARRRPEEADHVLPPTGWHRGAAERSIAILRGEAAGAPQRLDLRSLAGHPVGTANLLQVAASASLLSLGKVQGPGLVLSAGIHRTLAAVVVSKAHPTGT
jgi:3-oxoacyl-[acyl-carrier-protein] synthase II